MPMIKTETQRDIMRDYILSQMTNPPMSCYSKLPNAIFMA